MKMLLVRHAPTEKKPLNNPLEWPLTSGGHRDALALGAQAEFEQLDAIYASKQPKAIQTAEEIVRAQGHELGVISLDGLAECTYVTDGYLPNYNEDIARYHARETELNGDLESVDEAADRMMRTLNGLAHMHNDDDVIAVVSHSNALSAVSERLTGVSSYEWHQRIAMPDLAVVKWVDGSGAVMRQTWGS